MPIIKVNLIEGFATLAEKSQITMEMTEALVTVMGEVTRQFTYVSVEDMKPGAVSMGGQLVTEETMRGGLVLSEQELAVKLTASRVKAAYAALDSGDRTAIEQYWDKDLTWSVPGANPLAGTYEGLDAFLGYVQSRRDLSGGSFRSEEEQIMVDGHIAAYLCRNSAIRSSADCSCALAADLMQLLHWKNGRVISGQEAYFGDGATGNDAFWR
ncbi:nuclear transport factor 2 family protein [Kitasatospora sp. GAS204B]|uniref:nuclear transport factor 2 family protein n=1 Tax=unclassified Kitasatospora TaxID=2633591 RepID=UPI0024764E36|nr:nuclear transport factor 2 family protein [Kitasatospora sp. GAS204B]MDH6116721.1 ketosteroid isomerase-like protein/phenylpyruvate tautomerase PptA (4-oxalocrotonate tautomerase family) [Kitasatospora sp. GAS204B]